MRPSPRRLLMVIGGVLASAVGVVGGISVAPAGLVAIALIATAAGCLIAAKMRESGASARFSAVEAALLGGAATGGTVLVVAGLVVLTGGPATVVIVAVLGVAAALEATVRLRATGRNRPRPAPGTAPRPAPGPVPAAGQRPPVGPRPLVGPPSTGSVPELRPVGSLPTHALGQEWLLSTSVLGSLVDVGTRQSIARRRQELLDELERRDPVGFARWLAAGPRPGSDPATYLHGETQADTDAA